MFAVWLPCLPHRNSDCGMLAGKDSSPSCGCPRMVPQPVPAPLASAHFVWPLTQRLRGKHLRV